MGETSIEWTDATWNPVRGCSRVSPGCDNCYAMRQAHRFSGPGGKFEGLTTVRKVRVPVYSKDRVPTPDGLEGVFEVHTRGVDWSGRTRFVPEMLDLPLRWKRPRRIFVNSMSDLFHESLSNEEIAAVFGVMAGAPQHTFQVLTKRAKRMRSWFEWYEGTSGAGAWPTAAVYAAKHYITNYRLDAGELQDWPLPNVWLGVSSEDQQRADERIPLLLETPAVVRFVSAEPLLGPIDLRRSLGLQCEGCGAFGADIGARAWPRVDSSYRMGHIEGPDSVCGPFSRSPNAVGLDWVIVGGESGRGARPFGVAWARSIVKQCASAGVACFVKQLGARPFGTCSPDGYARVPELLDRSYLGIRNRKGGDPDEWPADLRVREFPPLCQPQE